MPLVPMSRGLLGALAVATAGAPLALRAQAVEASVAGGLAVPAGGYRRSRAAGPVLRGSVTVGAPERRVRLRGDLEGVWLLDRADRVPAYSSQGTLRALSAVGSVLIGARGPGPSPYVSAGLAMQRLTVQGFRNPYGTTLGLRAGAGVRWRVRHLRVHAEVTPHLVLTDFATGSDFGTGGYVPLVLGAGF